VWCSISTPTAATAARDGQSTDLLRCLQSEETSAAEQDITRLSMSSASQPSGPAIFMSEFGATTSIPLAGFDVEWAGWTNWGGSTGRGNSTTIHRLLGRGSRGARRVLLADRHGALTHVSPGSRGDPNSVIFNPFTGAFNMVYAPTKRRTESRP